MTTKEELKKEAEEKAGIYFDSLDYDHGNVSDTPFSACDIFAAYEKGAMDFAEPREKRITDLEKENTALRQEWDVMKSTITDAENLCDKLEKENADLQQKYLEESFEKAKLVKTNTKLKEKAIRIIRNLLTLSMPIDYAKCPAPLQKIAEAEQFLKDNEV